MMGAGFHSPVFIKGLELSENETPFPLHMSSQSEAKKREI